MILDLLQSALNVGVRAVLAPAVDRADWDFLPQQPSVEGLELVYALGLHPFSVLEVTSDRWRDELEELELLVIRADPRMVAIGECGLDFLRAKDPETRERQVAVFRAHLELARATGLPLTIHCVKAHGPMLELLRERPGPPVVMHAFSGSAETAAALVAAGHYISFAANICIPNARRALAAARAVPSERLLVETDSPDQTPPGRRPATNDPAFIVDVVERLAELRGVEPERLAEQTTTNACRLFGLAKPAFDGRELGG